MRELLTSLKEQVTEYGQFQVQSRQRTKGYGECRAHSNWSILSDPISATLTTDIS